MFQVPVGCRTCGPCSPPEPLCPRQTHECFRMSNSPGPASTAHTCTKKPEGVEIEKSSEGVHVLLLLSVICDFKEEI